MVRIRMARIGRTNTPFYRIGAYDSRNPRNGVCIENLGWYNPLEKTPEKQLSVNKERAQYWLSVGACPTHKTSTLLKKAGVVSVTQIKKADSPKAETKKK